MVVTYELTQRDFFESFIAHRNSSTLRKWFLRFMVSVVFVVSGFGLLVAVMHPYAHVWANFTPMFILAAIWAALMWASPWLAARKQFWKQPAAQGPRTLLLDSTGAHWRWDGGSSENEWKNYVRTLEGKNQFLFFTSPASFNILPKRALTPQQLTEVRALITQNVPRRQ